MNRTLLWLTVAAAAIGAWWLFVRRSQAAAGGLMPTPGQPPGSTIDSVTAYFQDLVAPRPPGSIDYLPPVTPAGPQGAAARAVAAGNQAINTFGGVSEQVFTSLCGSKGGSFCQVGAPIANFAGKATAAITVKSFEYGAKGVVAAAKKLKFW